MNHVETLREALARTLWANAAPLIGGRPTRQCYQDAGALLPIVAKWLRSDAVADEVEHHEAREVHRDQCGCDRWPNGCPNGYDAYSVNAAWALHALADFISPVAGRRGHDRPSEGCYLSPEEPDRAGALIPAAVPTETEPQLRTNPELMARIEDDMDHPERYTRRGRPQRKAN